LPGAGTTVAENQDSIHVLKRVLKSNYSALGLKLPQGFEKLNSSDRTFVTTGHQLTLCGGAAFLHHKIITTIAAARRQEKETGRAVVPVFWLASEDHDFEEVRWVRGGSEKHIWEHEGFSKKHPVGTMSLDGLRDVFENWVGDMPSYPCSDDFQEMRSSLQEAERNGESYSQLFTRWLHGWYGEFGLVVLDASHPNLKSLASELFASEISGNGIFSAVEQNSPAFVRDVNLFYSPPNSPRVGIIRSSEGQVIAGDEILNPQGEDWGRWCKANAESLSPSVLMRPLYQELLLSNSTVVVGPGEMNYWKQLKRAFEHSQIALPRVLLRNHILVVDAEAGSVAEKLNWDLSQGWWTQDDFIRSFVEGVLKETHRTSLEELKTDPAKASRILLELGIKNLELQNALKEKGPKLRKASKTAVKKIRQSIKSRHVGDIDKISRAALKLFREGAPQDRWANFHALSSPFGGFRTLVGKLVENSYSEGGIMQVLEEEY
jgi:bacillithiol biosynthesis cysteine-adding enzyme BshC